MEISDMIHGHNQHTLIKTAVSLCLYGYAISCLFIIGCSSSVRYHRDSTVLINSSQPVRTLSSRSDTSPSHQEHTTHSKKIQHGKASWYGKQFHGKRTASGEIFDMYTLTAAHRKLPFGTMIKVTNVDNGKSVTVRVNDRGPFKAGRIVDLSFGAARHIGLDTAGVCRVTLEVIE